LNKLFPNVSTRQEVVGILGAYGREDFHREVDRVHLGILKLSGTDLVEIKSWTNVACSDFRDLLVDAEYPLTFSKDRLKERDPGKYAKLEKKERDQYDQWLTSILAA
jgi:hypothetical protein